MLMKAPVKRPLGNKVSKRKQWSPNREVSESNSERGQILTLAKSPVSKARFSAVTIKKDNVFVQNSNQSLEKTIGNDNSL